MSVCIVCRSREAAGPSAVCERCATVLTAEGHPLAPAVLAPDRMTEVILKKLRQHVARHVGGVAFERELSDDEVDALLQSFPD